MVTATTAAVLKALVADCRPALSDRNRFLMNHAAPAASEDLASAADGLRTALRLATLPAHTRLHGHPGLGAVQAGTIDRRAYRALLSRLYGFHVPFEAAAGIEPERSRWLAADLQALGLDEPAIAGLPRCGYVPRLETEARRLGAAYVVEGSTLGGRELSKRLDHLFGPGTIAGRRFFGGRAADTGRAWRAFLGRLERSENDEAARAAVIAAAQETFAAFERWVEDWDGADAQR
jgi:heme oxygenase